jgi:site-specific DNA recombinase
VPFYGKTTRQRGTGGLLKDFIYYRCSGTDGYRFGGERICDNPQINGEFIETAVWKEVCGLLKNPNRLELEHLQSLPVGGGTDDPEIMKSQLGELQRGVERLIDSYSEGVIDKDQFMSRLSRTKSRITELEARVHANAAGTDGRQELRFLVEHHRKLAGHLGSDLEDADLGLQAEGHSQPG